MPSGDRPSGERGTLEDSQRRQRRLVAAERIWFGVLASFAVIVALGAGILLVSAHPRSCVTCHTSEAASVKANAHAAVRCESCHAADSVAGILQGRIAVIDMVAAAVVPARVPVVSDVPSGLCLDCHDQGMNQTVVVGAIRMNHRAPIEAGWECRTCHPGTGHEVRSELGGYTMDMCLGCHAATAANLATCEVCHVGDVKDAAPRSETLSPWRHTHGPQWRVTHGMGALATCGACHPASYCVRCHGDSVPHPENYLREHGRDVLARKDGSEKCFTCHRKTGCQDCHGLEMPHPAGFLQAHADETRERGEKYRATCTRCHKRESCDNCHARHAHPGLTREHIEGLRNRPVR